MDDKSDNWFIFYRKASVFTGICWKKGKHSYWVNIIYTINLRLLGHCICLKSSANVFWVIQKVFHLPCVASSCWRLNLWRLWNFQYLMKQNPKYLSSENFRLRLETLVVWGRRVQYLTHLLATMQTFIIRLLGHWTLHNLLLRPSFIIQFVLNWADELYFILGRFMLSKNKFYFLIFLKYFFLESKTKLKSSKNHLKTRASHTFYFIMSDLFCFMSVQLIIFSSRFFFPPQMKKCSPYQEKCWKGQTF